MKTHTPIRIRAALLALAALACAHPLVAAERSQTPVKYTWDLTALYANEAAWTTAKQSIEKRIPTLAHYQGHLGSADSLLAALDAQMAVDRDLARLSTYASMVADQDQRDSKHIEMRESADDLYVKYGSVIAYLRPEILGLGADKVKSFMTAQPKLQLYRVYLDDILRYAPHTLTPAEEKVVAQAGRMAGAGATIRGIFKNAELPYPTIRLSTGESVRIDDAAYTKYRALPNRADRDSVFHAFWGKHAEFKGTFGAALNEQVQAHIFYRDVHHFNSCVEAALFGSNIPPKVYSQLVSDVHASLPTLHRYLRLRQRMMGLKQLRYEDLYAPIVKEVDLHYTPEEAQQLVLGAVAPLGQAYVDSLKHGYESRWIDWMPNTGKASGAYSTGAYGVHPYQLQNFTGLYDEVSTLAHESGHSMHTFLADHRQPYVTHDYSTFVAEVASTCNENLLLHYMLDRTKDKPTRLFLLGSYLENLRTTLFRQTMFAEFELKAHEMAEKGTPLTGDNLTKLYLDLVRTYYGDAQGVCKVDSLYGIEWTYIDHFYYNFYVYQYATSIVASSSIANMIREEHRLEQGTKHRDAYLDMLASGSSKYPIDLLKGAGVDMTTSAPFQAAMKEMNTVMDEMERTLK